MSAIRDRRCSAPKPLDEILHPASARRPAHPGAAPCRSRRARRRVRRPDRPLRRRQIHPAAQPVRQLPRRCRPYLGAPRRRDGRHRRRPAAHHRAGARRPRSAMSASSCAWCRACPRSTSSPRPPRGLHPDAARARAEALLLRLNIPRRLHALPPATFSGGEQQRVNLARGFIGAPSGAAARRAHRQPGRRKPRHRHRHDPRGEGAKALPSSASSTTPTSATRSPTACTR